MRDKGSNKVTNLQSLLDDVEKSILEASDEEILQEARDDGENIETLVSDVSQIISNSINGSRKLKLRTAREAYERAVQSRQSGSNVIPDSASERRKMLKQLISAPNNIPAEITVVFREGQDLSDEDVESLLENLLELGLIHDC